MSIGTNSVELDIKADASVIDHVLVDRLNGIKSRYKSILERLQACDNTSSEIENLRQKKHKAFDEVMSFCFKGIANKNIVILPEERPRTVTGDKIVLSRLGIRQLYFRSNGETEKRTYPLREYKRKLFDPNVDVAKILKELKVKQAYIDDFIKLKEIYNMLEGIKDKKEREYNYIVYCKIPETEVLQPKSRYSEDEMPEKKTAIMLGVRDGYRKEIILECKDKNGGSPEAYNVSDYHWYQAVGLEPLFNYCDKLADETAVVLQTKLDANKQLYADYDKKIGEFLTMIRV